MRKIVLQMMITLNGRVGLHYVPRQLEDKKRPDSFTDMRT